MTRPQTDRVTVGTVVKPHGIRGEVVVDPQTDRPERFEVGTVLHGEGADYTIAASRPHKGRMLVAFEGVPDRNAAEELRDLELTADPLDVDQHETYLTSELTGMRVVHDDGRDLGTVTAVIELPTSVEYDLLEVTRDDGSEWLLPAVGEYVAIDVDETGTELLVVTEHAPPGLVDDAAAVDARPADPGTGGDAA